MAAMAAKVVFEAIARGTEKLPDKYWDRIPGLRPPKTEKEDKETKAKVDANEEEYGRFGNQKRQQNDRDRNSRRISDVQQDDRYFFTRDDRLHPRRRSQSNERHPDRWRDRNVRAERRRLERRASSYSPPPSEDEEFYNDAERQRQERRAHKYTCNDPSHQRWGRRDLPAAHIDRPYIPIPQPGVHAPSPYAQFSPPGPAGVPPHGRAPSYDPAAFPQTAPYGQQVAVLPPPRGPPLQGASSRPPSSFAHFQSRSSSGSPPSRTSSGFSPQPSSPYTPLSAPSSRSASRTSGDSRRQSLQPQHLSRAQTLPVQAPVPPGVVASPSMAGSPASTSSRSASQMSGDSRRQSLQPQRVSRAQTLPMQAPVPTGVVPSPLIAGSPASESKAAQKYTPLGVAMGSDMYPSPEH